MKINKITDDVFYVSGNNFPLDSEKIKKLVDEARKSSRKRARLCVHNDNGSNLHEMFIAKLKNTYVRPHKNHNKCKSFQVLDGIIDLVIFDNIGNITDVINDGKHGDLFSNISKNSNSEKTIAAMAIRLALLSVSNLPKPNRCAETRNSAPKYEKVRKKQSILLMD